MQRHEQKLKIKKMKNLIIIGFLLIQLSSVAQDFITQLEKLPGVTSVKKITSDTTFNAQYELFFEQYLDHKNPDFGTFQQRVVLSHKNIDLPVVVELEGYKIWSIRENELANLLNANQVNIEHRFFKDSRPENVPWEKLNIYQAATDQHNIIKALQNIYKENWISTGISKGGQTTMYHRYFYPNDVTASVPYVAPLNFAQVDPRIEKFLSSVGQDNERQKIYDFQCACFENEKAMLKQLKKKTKEKKWEFKPTIEQILHYAIMEYPFAYWQWGGTSIDDIPGKDASAKDLFNHLNRIAGFTFFEEHDVDNNRAFFHAALHELGIYNYNTKPFKKYLGDVPNYTFEFTAPEGYLPEYNAESMQKVKQFLDTEANNMLFIVGGLDPWGSTAYHTSGKNNLVTMVLKNGHHGTRIRHFNASEREIIYALLERWMGVEIEK
jgi:hypothetical protein